MTVLTLELNSMERAAFCRLSATFARSARFTRLAAAYLNEDARLITPELVAELVSDTGVSEREAVTAILSAAFGLNGEENEDDRALERDFLTPAVREADPAVYRADPYFQNIRVPGKRVENWDLASDFYTPYEGFVSGGITVTPDLRVYPRLGYFREKFTFPCVREDGVEWMAIKPNEIETMRAPLASAHGKVVAFGLGLGYFAYMAARKPEVTSVTVVERDERVIRLFREELLPQFDCREKIRVVPADAFDFVQNDLARGGYDHAFCDLWHDVSDGLPLYLRMRRAEPAGTGTVFSYWIEDMLLNELRTFVFRELETAFSGTPCPGNGRPVRGMAEVKRMLSDPFLRELAPTLRPIGGKETP